MRRPRCAFGASPTGGATSGRAEPDPRGQLDGLQSPASGAADEDRFVTADGADTAPLLEVDGLRTWFDTLTGRVRSVDGVSFTVERGSITALVGASISRMPGPPFGPS